jgi:hypothetical protein
MKKLFLISLVLVFTAVISIALFTSCGNGGDGDGDGDGVTPMTMPSEVIGTFAMGGEAGVVTLSFSESSAQYLSESDQFSTMNYEAAQASSGTVSGELTIGGKIGSITGTWSESGGTYTIMATATIDSTTYTITGTYTDEGGFNLEITDGVDYGAIAVMDLEDTEVTDYTVYIGYYDVWTPVPGDVTWDIETNELWWVQASVDFDLSFSDYLEDPENNLSSFSYTPVSKDPDTTFPVTINVDWPGIFYRFGSFNLTLVGSNFVGTYANYDDFNPPKGDYGTFKGVVTVDNIIKITHTKSKDDDDYIDIVAEGGYPFPGKFDTNTIEGVWAMDVDAYGQWQCNAQVSNGAIPDGTITVSLFNATPDANGHEMGFGIMNEGEVPFTATLPIGVGGGTIANGTVESQAVDLNPPFNVITFTGGSKYDVYIFVDLDDSGDIEAGEPAGFKLGVEVIGDTTVSFDYVNELQPFVP